MSIRAAYTIAHALIAYIACTATGCGRWGRRCRFCGHRRWSPFLYRHGED